MAGLLPNEGENLLVTLLCKGSSVDRGTDLDLVLFTNTTISETITAATLTQPTGGGYAAKALTDASWTVTADTASYAKQVFTVATTDYNLPVYGYAILTKGTTPRIVAIELDPTGPLALVVGDTYGITPNIVGA